MDDPKHHGIMIVLAGGKKKKKKKGGAVEGKAARRHLGKRARGGADDLMAKDAREAAHYPDGRDGVPHGHGSSEIADMMGDARASGGRLTASERHKMPSSEFALPGKGEGNSGKGPGSYPLPDEKHGRVALSLVSQHGTPEEKSKVRAAVHRKFPDIHEG